jgi:murein DD-endopeptidase MepM/ murein hydrolase activator NlpD
MASQNLFDPSDAESTSFAAIGSDIEFEGMPKGFIKYFREAKKLVDQIADAWSETMKDTEDSVRKMSSDKPGAGRLGLGSFTRAEKVGMGVALAGFGASTYMRAAPNTMAAVTQRMGADTYAGLSGMSSRQAIMQANRQVGGGATSAMGPTMAAMNLTYQGGYTASSLSSKNIMSQIGGMSAMSGMSNEMAAASVAGMNGMSFLRAGVQIRDREGNLKPPNQIINDVYSFLYRGQKITKDQAALVLNPGSKGYATIQQITGGDPQLMQMIQSGIIARASAGSDKKFSSAMTSKDPNTMLDVLGVDKSSPIRSNFRFNSSENRKLESTEQGLVGGYNVSLRTTAALNDAYSVMADTLGPVNDGLMTLKGILQTLPNAGNMGGVIASFTGALAGAASTLLQFALLSRLLGGAGAAGLLGKAGGAAAVATGAAKMGGKFLKGGVLAAGATVAGDAIKSGSTKGSARSRAGNAAKYAGMAAGATAMFNAIPGLGQIGFGITTSLGALYGAATGGPHDHGNLGVGGPNEGPSTPTPFASPVPKATPITSPFGPRDNSQNPQISSNHKGIDFGTPSGTALTAITDGVISTIGNEAKGYGQWIEVKHEDGTASRYAHLSQINVSRGQKVVPGQVVGRSGGKKGQAGAGNSTGAHLHFEILNEKGVKVNPAAYLSGAPASPINGNMTASAVAGPKAIGSESMWAAKKAAAKGKGKGKFTGKNVSQLSSPALTTSLSTSSFNEDLGGPISTMNVGVANSSSNIGGPSAAMNVGVASSSSDAKNVTINLQMKVSIAQGSVQEADRLVRLVGKKLTDSDVLKKIGSAL